MKLTIKQRNDMINEILDSWLSDIRSDTIRSILKYGRIGYDNYTDNELQEEYTRLFNEEVQS